MRTTTTGSPSWADGPATAVSASCDSAAHSRLFPVMRLVTGGASNDGCGGTQPLVQTLCCYGTRSRMHESLTARQNSNVRFLPIYVRFTPETYRNIGECLPASFDPKQTCRDSQAFAPQSPQRSVVRRTEMREPSQSGGAPSRTSDQPILIEVVNAKMRP